MTQLSREAMRAYNRRRREAARIFGRCRDCGREAVSRSFCAEHLAVHNAGGRRRYVAKERAA